eukprot:Phypoly_transcript_07251.p1 GENE.Phypoly_transcript_07251~~Phypoly_transcript_07251.p1  ORF type:complete len:308 (+),score=33.69 Phypoly_transcript_07251:476-1399(+)
MGATKSKNRRIRSSTSAPIPTSRSYPLYHANPTLYIAANTAHFEHNNNPPNGHINDNLINIVNIINNINNNNLLEDNNENTLNSTSNNNNATEPERNISQRKKHTTKDIFGDEVLIIDCNSFVIDESDQLSRTTTHVIWRILSMLTMRELCNVQQVSHFWYSAGKENEVWKLLLLRDSLIWEASSKGLVNTLKSSALPVKWKKIAREECSLQQCWKCKRKFQKCHNSAIACMYHPQGRELIEDKIGAPSGVYWTCCLNRSKISPGCVIGYHSEYEWAKDGKGRGRRDVPGARDRAIVEGARGWRVSL